MGLSRWKLARCLAMASMEKRPLGTSSRAGIAGQNAEQHEVERRDEGDREQRVQDLPDEVAPLIHGETAGATRWSSSRPFPSSPRSLRPRRAATGCDGGRTCPARETTRWGLQLMQATRSTCGPVVDATPQRPNCYRIRTPCAQARHAGRCRTGGLACYEKHHELARVGSLAHDRTSTSPPRRGAGRCTAGAGGPLPRRAQRPAPPRRSRPGVGRSAIREGRRDAP